VLTAIESGTLANRPAPGNADSYYWATDVQMLYRDTGAAWDAIAHGNLAGVTPWQHHEHYQRYIEMCLFGHDGENAVGIGTVYYSPVIITETVTVDAIGVFHGGNAADDIYVAIYDQTDELPVNRLGVSLSTAQTGTNRKQLVPLTSTLQLTPDLYYLAFVSESGSAFSRISHVIAGPAAVTPLVHGPLFYNEPLGAYGPPPAIATPTTCDIYHCFNMFARVVSTP